MEGPGSGVLGIGTTERTELSAFVTGLVEGHRDFAAFCECCGGAWPGTIREVLDAIDSPGARRLSESSRASGRRVTCDRRLPLPHLLDADWRFTRDGAENVLDTLLRASDRDLLLIGMPSVALAAGDRGLSSRITVASRPDDPIDDALRSALPGARFLDLRRLPCDAFGAAALVLQSGLCVVVLWRGRIHDDER